MFSGKREFLFDKNSQELKIITTRIIFKRIRVLSILDIVHIACDVRGYIQTKNAFSRFTYFLAMKDGARILISKVPLLVLIKWNKTENPEAIEKLAQFLDLKVIKKRVIK